MDSIEDLYGVCKNATVGKETEEEKNAAVAEVCKEGGNFRYWTDKFLIRQQEAKKKEIFKYSPDIL